MKLCILFSIIFLLFIIVFLYCACKVSSDSDEDIKNMQKNNLV